MTEKRFQEYYQGNTIVSIHDKENNNELVNILQCVELLNELHEENEQLKQLIKKALETTPIEHSLAIELKNSVRELYD